MICHKCEEEYKAAYFDRCPSCNAKPKMELNTEGVGDGSFEWPREEILSDLKTCLDWIEDGEVDGEEGFDLLVSPLRAKYNLSRGYDFGCTPIRPMTPEDLPPPIDTPKPSTRPVWWIEWKHRASRANMVDTVPLNDSGGLLRKLNHATAFAEDHKVTVTQYWPNQKETK